MHIKVISISQLVLSSRNCCLPFPIEFSSVDYHGRDGWRWKSREWEKERDEARRQKVNRKFSFSFIFSFSFFCIPVLFHVLFGGSLFHGSRLKIKWNLSRFNASLPLAKVKWAMCIIKNRKKKPRKNEAKKVIQLWDTQTGFQARLRAACLRFFVFFFEVSHIFQLKLNMQSNKRVKGGIKGERERELGTTGISAKFFRNFVTCVS